MINYTWTVTDLLTIDVDQDPDYVVFANYKVLAEDGQYSAEFEALINFEVDPGPSFIPYQQLTNDIVVNWIKSYLGTPGIDSIYADLENQINFKKNPPRSPQLKPLPWS
jgi:hypothetical protein